MAAKPGPILLLGGVAALLLMSKKKKPTDLKDVVEEKKKDEQKAEEKEKKEAEKKGGKTKKKRKNPPNVSGDEKGYNTKLFPDSRSVRKALKSLGYSIEVNDEVVKKNAACKQFQRDYNKVSADGDYADLNVYGTLAVDGTAGKNTLRALEIALAFMAGWKNMVAGAKPKPAPAGAGEVRVSEDGREVVVGTNWVAQVLDVWVQDWLSDPEKTRVVPIVFANFQKVPAEIKWKGDYYTIDSLPDTKAVSDFKTMIIKRMDALL